ncbi:hypothetical protein NDA16_000101 [Ustilago loliicola]|nr:hypothetical protein NDA16_000101 [Ustilago loliicola]
MDTVFGKCAKPAVYAELEQGLQPFVYWHVTESIQEGYTPDAIGELQEEVEVEALVLERKSAARDRALGRFVSLLHHYLARNTDPNNIEAALKLIELDLDKEGPPAPLSEFHLHTADIYEYVEEQRQNAGLIADDPDWHQRPKTNAKLQWNVLFKTSLEQTRVAYVEACRRFEHQFVVGGQADVVLIKQLSGQDLARLVSECHAKPRHIPAPPLSAASPSASPSGYWDKRVGGSRSAAHKAVPEFDPVQLIQAGQSFRAACIDHIRHQRAFTSRTPEAERDLDVVMSQALNPESDPERLYKRALERYDSATPSPDEETIIQSTKDMLSSALRILKTRDGERNVHLRVDAHNLRGKINLRLAALRPRSEGNYLSRAVADWSASLYLDEDQPDVTKELTGAKARLEAHSKENGESASTHSILSRKSAGSESAYEASTDTAAPAVAATQGPSTSKNKAENTKASATAANGSGQPQAEATNKPREKTILESPFFRSDLVTGLMVDSLLALPFPHKALRETVRMPPAAAVASASQDHIPMLDRLAKSHQQITKALAPENKAQLKDAVKAVSAVLALPDMQQVTRDDAPEKILRRTSLRLVLGTLHLLLNDLVKAQTELDLVSNALRPNIRAGKSNAQQKNGRNKSDARAESKPSAEAQPADTQAVDSSSTANPAKNIIDSSENDAEANGLILQMQTRVQGEALFLLAKTCWMANKVQESVKFFRWFVKWYSEQQADIAADKAEEIKEGDNKEIDLPELDMSWWDKVLVVEKK